MGEVNYKLGKYMNRKKVFIAIHQLNLGGAQKALVSALNAIDYDKNEITLYIRKDRLNLLPQVNSCVSKIIVNKDYTQYYHKLYSLFLYALSKIYSLFGKDSSVINQKSMRYIAENKIAYEREHYFSNDYVYDIAISYIQGYTAKSVLENVKARRKIMFYHDSTDSLHELHSEVMKYYDMIYCVSKGAQEAVKGFYPQFADKIYCLENYVDADKVRTEAEKFVPDYSKDNLILCSCGRITPVKGFDLAVGAAELLKQKGLDFKWYFVGDGVDRPKIEMLISEKGLRDYIKITGLQDNPYPYIKHCNIYVQPSYEEAHPLSIIEAQILARPVVSTATAGGKSIIEDGINGIIAEIDLQSLSDKIYRLAKDREMRVQFEKELSKNDYKEDYIRFRKQWAILLGD